MSMRLTIISLILMSFAMCFATHGLRSDDTPPQKAANNTANAKCLPGDTTIDSATVEKWSQKYLKWKNYYADYVIPGNPNISGFPKVHMTDVPTVYQIPDDPKWYMTFIGFDGQGYQSFVAVSNDLIHWKQLGLAMGYGPKGEFDHGGVVLGAYLYETYDIAAPRQLKKHNGKYWSLYGAYRNQGGYEVRPGYEGVATSDDGIHWRRSKEQPNYILSVHERDVKPWEKDCIYQPWLVEHQGKYYNFYNAANGHVEQIGMTTSTDLLHWNRYADNPVIRNRPNLEDARMAADGKVFRDGDHWVMFYFGVKDAHAHVMVAFSRDLTHWTARRDPIVLAGGHPHGLDSDHAHKISLVFNPKNETWYMFYNAVGTKGRGIGLLTNKPL